MGYVTCLEHFMRQKGKILICELKRNESILNELLLPYVDPDHLKGTLRKNY